MDMFYLTDLLSDEIHQLDERRHLSTQDSMDQEALEQQMQLQSQDQIEEPSSNYYSGDVCEQENNSLPESSDSQLLLSSIATPQPSATLLTTASESPAAKLSYASIVTSNNHSTSNVLRSRQVQPQAAASVVPRISLSSAKTPTNRKSQLKPRSSSLLKSQNRQPKSNTKKKNSSTVELSDSIATSAASSFFSSLLQLGSRPIAPIPSFCTPFSAATLSHLESISPASKLAITDELDAKVDQSDDIDELDVSISDAVACEEDADASFHELLTLNLTTPSSTKQLTFEALSPYSKEISKIIEEEGDYEDLLSSPTVLAATECKYDIPADNSLTPPLVKPQSFSACTLTGVSESDMASIRLAEELLSPRRSSLQSSRDSAAISPLILSPMSGKAYQLSKSYTPPRGNQQHSQAQYSKLQSISSFFGSISQRSFAFLSFLVITIILLHIVSVLAGTSSLYDSLFSVSDWDTVDFFGVIELSVPQLLRDILLMESWPGLSMKFASSVSHTALPVQQRFLS